MTKQRLTKSARRALTGRSQRSSALLAQTMPIRLICLVTALVSRLKAAQVTTRSPPVKVMTSSMAVQATISSTSMKLTAPTPSPVVKTQAMQTQIQLISQAFLALTALLSPMMATNPRIMLLVQALTAHLMKSKQLSVQITPTPSMRRSTPLALKLTQAQATTPSRVAKAMMTSMRAPVTIRSRSTTTLATTPLSAAKMRATTT